MPQINKVRSIKITIEEFIDLVHISKPLYVNGDLVDRITKGHSNGAHWVWVSNPLLVAVEKTRSYKYFKRGNLILIKDVLRASYILIRLNA